jgi:hypothetical protein
MVRTMTDIDVDVEMNGAMVRNVETGTMGR